MAQVTMGNRFDVILMNPPYYGSLHLKFLEKAIEISDKVVSVQPGNILYTDFGRREKFIDFCKSNKVKPKFVELGNFNKDFNTGLCAPFAISYFDNTTKQETILFNNYGDESTVNNVEDINLIADNDIIQSIHNKVVDAGLEFCDRYYFTGKTKYYKKLNIAGNAAFLRNLADVITVSSYDSKANWVLDEFHNEEYYGFITATYVHKNKNEIVSKPELQDDMSHPNGWIYYDKYDTFEENKEKLNNFKKFILNSNLAHYLCFAYPGYTYRNQMPLYTLEFESDNDIYSFFKLTGDEIELIEKICNKINRKSEWFREYFK